MSEPRGDGEKRADHGQSGRQRGEGRGKAAGSQRGEAGPHGGRGQRGHGQRGRGRRGRRGKDNEPHGQERGRSHKPARGQGVRRLAASIVGGVLAGRGAARTHLERAFENAAEEGNDLRSGLLTELVYGTIRHLGTLDLLLNACAKKGLRKIEDDVLGHLRVAAYQLVFLDRVPAAVAVSEAVTAVGQRSHVRGFVNGVLRQLGRRVQAKHKGDTPPLGIPSTRRFPGRDGGWVVLSDPLLPEAESDPSGWLSAATSLPRALVTGWIATHGFEGALEIARAQNAPPPLTLRVNQLRANREGLMEVLSASGLESSEGEHPSSIVLQGSLSKGGLEYLWAGLASVQDETAMAVAPMLQPEAGERIVDLCAAPGGKTTHLAELMRDLGEVEALDVDADRLAKVDQAVARLGLRCVRTHLVDPDDPRPPEGQPIDRVLADVPCSNTGVLRRRVEVRWRHAQLDRPRLLALQARLLDRAVDLVRPGGVVVYSTCSIEPEENQGQVQALLQRRADVVLEEERQTLPRRGGGDGGYAARIRRIPT